MWTSREYLNDLEFESIRSWIETVDAYVSEPCDDDEDYTIHIDNTEYNVTECEMEDAYNTIYQYVSDDLDERFTLDNLFDRSRDAVINMLTKKIYNNYYYY